MISREDESIPPSSATSADSPVVLTIGHSNRPFSEILALLKTYGVQILLDIRSRDYSNLVPDFSRQRMKMRLIADGIVYIFMGDLLGEEPKGGHFRTRLETLDLIKVETSEPFDKGLSWILEESRHSRICLFCGEADPFVCHRHHLVGQCLVSRGLRVRHILHTGQLEDLQPDLFHRPREAI